ncbi:D-amino acid dehydrogenase [Hydrogenophaga sp.]|uniref:D-amino acid dehydrogenase n=1 Tax=Hydrogenophaga sp. TaxID=1904254 RepID=UPI002611BAE9|nr:D-amino acid dehydrogenase [Hydrogenophaga sp.]MCW5655605.1 D-amino acid dehydrogenase [Hydrogenophaga sp.]
MNAPSSSSSSRHVCVLGAGIVGLATAWQLHRDGHHVTVVDSAHTGAGASGANGAQLSYSYVQPLADPSLWLQLPRLLLAADSPLKFRLRMDPHQWAWGLRFLAACRASVSRNTTAQLLALAAESRAAFDLLRTQESLACDFSATGKLVLYPDEASFAGARRQMALQQSMGTSQQAVSAREAVAIEPALAHYAPRFAGAIHTPSECAADCLMVCEALQRLLQTRGVRFRFQTEVTRLVRHGRRIIAADTREGGRIEADAFVVALGTGSHRLAAPLGLTVPVYPLKGYSITVPVDATAEGVAPRVNVTDAKRKVVFARIGERLRVAGMAELVGYGRDIPADRIASLVDSTRDVFPQAGRFENVQPWAGLRPATPTGLPVLGRLPGAPDNLLFNTGHGALGFTLAFGSAQRVAAALGPALRPVAAGLAAYSA